MSKDGRARQNRQRAEMAIMNAATELAEVHSYLMRADRPLQPDARADLERVAVKAKKLLKDDDARREFAVGDVDAA